MSNKIRKLFNLIKPKFNELTTYLTSVVCILILILYPEVIEAYLYDLAHAQGKMGGWFLTIPFLAAAGILLSVAHVFVKYKKSAIEKQLMGAFVMGAQGVAGIAAGVEMYRGEWSFLTIFPIWNIVVGVLLLYQIGLVDENIITDEDATLAEVAVVTVTLLCVFAISYYWLKLSWAMTFSVCMCYSSLVALLFVRIMDFIHIRTDAV